jgi:adenine nucleotide transporter 17
MAAVAAEALASATSGAVGSVLSKFLTYPMDLMKVKMSVKKQGETFGSVVAAMRRQGGLKAFYVGLSPKLVRSGAQKFLYFYTYSALMQLHARWAAGARLGVGTNLLLGLLADWFSIHVVVPLDLITTQRQTTKDEEGIGAILARIYNAEGLSGFYKGTSGFMSGSIQPAVQFTIYDQIRQLWMRLVVAGPGLDSGGELSAGVAFLLGAGSRALSELLTYPTMVVQYVQMATPGRDDVWGELKGQGVLAVLLGVWRKGGVRSLYAGLGPQLGQAVLGAAIMMMTKEKISAAVRALIVN